MSSCCCSYVEMESEEIKKLAQSCLDRIHSSRQRQVDVIVQEELERMTFWARLFNRLFFWRKPDVPTIADAEIAVKVPDKFPGSAYEWIMEKYGRQEGAATQLIFAASKAKTIKVSTDYLYLIR